MKFPTVAGFKGINNRLDPTQMGLQWQLQADNSLCDDAGFLVRRPGAAAVLANSADLYGTPEGRLWVVTTDGRLQEIGADGVAHERASGFYGAPFAWTTLGYVTFALSETAAWAIYPDRVTAWGIPALSAPTVRLAAGSFAPGTYLAACSLVAPDGRLGGCSGVASMALNGQGVTITSAPVAGYTTRLYLSEPDGATLYSAGSLPPSGSVTLAALPTLGARLTTQNRYPPPLGGRIAAQGNRICVAIWEPEHDRSVLYWSQPDAPHWFALDTDYQLVAGPVMLLASVGLTLLIGTDRAIYIDSPGAPRQTIAAFGALPDTLARIGPDKIAFWSERGLCVFPPLELPTDAALVPDNRRVTTGAMLDHAGSSYYVTVQRGPSQPRNRPPYLPLPITVQTGG